jgi:hypothetical protein
MVAEGWRWRNARKRRRQRVFARFDDASTWQIIRDTATFDSWQGGHATNNREHGVLFIHYEFLINVLGNPWCGAAIRGMELQ